MTALSREVRKLPADLRRTLTWDRGSELALQKRFSVATDVKVYFCDPRSPWQRGNQREHQPTSPTVLLRQYFPDGTDLSAYTQRDLNEIALKLNNRPRKTLGFASPSQKFQDVLP